MTENEYTRTVSQLRDRAVKWWPPHIRDAVLSSDPAEPLLETFDEFNRFLDSAPTDPLRFREYVFGHDLKVNVILKHLMVLLDQGGERIQRYVTDKDSIFEKRRDQWGLPVDIDAQRVFLDLTSLLSRKRVDNGVLGVDGPGMRKTPRNPELSTDLVVLLAFGFLASNGESASKLSGCDGLLFLNARDFRQAEQSKRYIRVSRIVGGAAANTRGQILQSEVEQRLRYLLEDANVAVTRNHTLIEDTQNITSDVFVEWEGGGVSIEVAFQETTNSTIERKGNEAKSRAQRLAEHGIHTAYVVDGEGCFQRRSAVEKICDNSSCTVAFSDAEFQVLAQFIKEKLPQ